MTKQELERVKESVEDLKQSLIDAANNIDDLLVNIEPEEEMREVTVRIPVSDLPVIEKEVVKRVVTPATIELLEEEFSPEFSRHLLDGNLHNNIPGLTSPSDDLYRFLQYIQDYIVIKEGNFRIFPVDEAIDSDCVVPKLDKLDETKFNGRLSNFNEPWLVLCLSYENSHIDLRSYSSKRGEYLDTDESDFVSVNRDYSHRDFGYYVGKSWIVFPGNDSVIENDVVEYVIEAINNSNRR